MGAGPEKKERVERQPTQTRSPLGDHWTRAAADARFVFGNSRNGASYLVLSIAAFSTTAVLFLHLNWTTPRAHPKVRFWRWCVSGVMRKVGK